MEQFYNGDTTVVTLDGERVAEPQVIRVSDFLRKTNYYWFAMMFKLLDPGIKYELLDDQKLEGTAYKRVEITFDQGVGDVQDKYVLYIHPETKMVDQFLFTVLDFGVEQPNLMKVTYEEIDGVKIPTYRKYAQANWEGEPQTDSWTEEVSRNISFGKGFAEEDLALLPE